MIIALALVYTIVLNAAFSLIASFCTSVYFGLKIDEDLTEDDDI